MPTILLIEDNKNILDNLVECFELNGYQTLSADNGKKGVDLLATCTPDLIICDILMPGLNGYEVLQAVRENSCTRFIPFVFSTSKSEKNELSEALFLGADGVMTKPYDPDLLIQMTRKLIASRLLHGKKQR